MRQKIAHVSFFLIALSFSLFFFSPACEILHAGIVSDTVETITLTRNPVEGNPPVTISYILIKIDNPVGTVILVEGGNGKLFLSDWQIYTGNAGFLVRIRYHLAAEGFNVVVIDAASDYLLSGNGLLGRRTDFEHLSDISAVINNLPVKLGKNPGPICLIGMSRGSISVGAYAAEAVINPALSSISSLIFTSPVTRSTADLMENLLDNVELELINVPCYLVAHESDKCWASPPSDITIMKSRLSVSSPKVKANLFSGGTSTLSSECNSLSAHGFFGIEQKVVNKIGTWLTSQDNN